MNLNRVLDEGYGPGAWYGSDLKAAVADVTPATAFKRPAKGRHNIAEVALHHAYWAGQIESKLTGQPAAAFPLVRSGPGEAVFENPSHDFPQRVIYRREGDRLTGRIEGRSNGTEQAMEWHYRAAPLNAGCGGD
ncbi:MAG TPA: DUF6265 family protein [Vicinamibacterales bacterium]|nr:DUF6265 family protein [Vicinamibacterales bacterium]